MPKCWVKCPLIVQEGGERYAKIMDIPDLGRPPFQYKGEDVRKSLSYGEMSFDRTATDSSTFAVCLASGVDLSAIDLDPDITRLSDEFEEESEIYLARTPRELNWTRARLEAVVDTETPGRDETIGAYVARVAARNDRPYA